MILSPVSDADLDRAFAALADPVRRAIIARLSRGAATVNELAEPFEISKQAVSKHIQVLELAGLVSRTRDAQRRPVHLEAARLEAMTAWIDRYRLARRAAVPVARRRPRTHHPIRRESGNHTEHNRQGAAVMSNPLTLDIPAGKPWIDFTREFDAPVEAVFNAHRDPELVRQWLGPRGYEMQIERWDFTSGGGYRYTHRDGDNVYAFRGTFHTVRENELAIQTFEFEGAPDEVAIEFMRFVDLGDGRCRLEGHSVGPTVEGRDMMVQSGMEKGMAQGYEQLDELLGVAAPATAQG